MNLHLENACPGSRRGCQGGGTAQVGPAQQPASAGGISGIFGRLAAWVSRAPCFPSWFCLCTQLCIIARNLGQQHCDIHGLLQGVMESQARASQNVREAAGLVLGFRGGGAEAVKDKGRLKVT